MSQTAVTLAVVYLPKDFTFSCRFRTSWKDERRFGLFGWVLIERRRLHRIVCFNYATSVMNSWYASSSLYFATARQVVIVKEDFSCDCESRRHTSTILGPLFATSSEIWFGVVIRMPCGSELYPHVPLRNALAIMRSQDVTAIESNRYRDTLIR